MTNFDTPHKGNNKSHSYKLPYMIYVRGGPHNDNKWHPYKSTYDKEIDSEPYHKLGYEEVIIRPNKRQPKTYKGHEFYYSEIK